MNNMLSKALREFMTGSLKQLIVNLGGEDGDRWEEELKRFNRKEPCWVKETMVWKTWKTIKLGTGLKTADDFRKAFKASGNRIGDYANDILGKPAFSAAAKESELELVKVSVKELGFKNGATRQEIYQRAQELGLKICPNEVGPQLRLQYENQPNGEWVLVAMEPISDSDGYLLLFHVTHDDGGQWLGSYCGGPDDVWDADHVFVFCK